MLRAIARRLVALPLIVFSACLLGFAYALAAQGATCADSPFGAQAPPTAVPESTLAQIGALARLDFGAAPDGTSSLAQVIFAATVNSLGLLPASTVAPRVRIG